MAFADGVDKTHQKLLINKTVETLKKLGVSLAWLLTQTFDPMAWPAVDWEMDLRADGTMLVKISL
jgi:hypothetical protein